MLTVWLVVKHEIVSVLGKRSFWIMTFLFPVLILGVLWALTVLVSRDFAPGFIPFGILGGLLAGFIEEIGWMGFAFPRMERKFGTWRATICLALLHGLWHAVPGYLGESGSYGAYWLPRFIAMWLVGAVVVIAGLRGKASAE